MSGDLQAKMTQALALHKSHQWQEAEQLYTQCIDDDPKNVQALYLLGSLYYQTKRLEQGLRLLQQAHAVQIDHIPTLHNLAAIAKDMKQYELAYQYAKDGLKLAPKQLGFYHILSNILLANNKLIEAETICRQGLQIDPNDQSLLNNLGTTLLQADQTKQAAIYFKALLKQEPDNAVFLCNAGACYKALGDTKQAYACYKRSINQHPIVQAYYNLALLYLDDSEYELALIHLDQATELDASYVPAHIEKGNVLKYLGFIERALESYEIANKLAPQDAAIYRTLVNVMPEIPKDMTESMQSLLNEDLVSEEEKPDLYLALSRDYHKKGKYHDSFQYLKKANDCYRKQIQYDILFQEGVVEAITERFDQDLFSLIEKRQYDSSHLIFIVSMPRSGSSLVEAILGAHSQVSAAGELNLFTDTVTTYYKSMLHCIMQSKQWEENVFEKMAHRYLKNLPDPIADETVVIDKMPFNFMWLGLIRLVFPDCKIIHCYRNPIDTCFSCYQHHAKGSSYFSYNLEELARYYLSYRKVMQHWQGLLGDSIFQLDYDVLKDESEETIRALLRHCGLAEEKNCFTSEKKIITKTSSLSQAKEPLSKAGQGKWKNYEEYLEPLITRIRSHL